MGRLNQRAKAERFRNNLRALIEHEGWTQREAAKHLELDYDKLRKYINSGIANETAKNRPDLERICKKFGVGKIEFLWASKLKPDRRPMADKESETESIVYQLRCLL